MEVHEQLEGLFREVSDDEQPVLTDQTTARHIPKWDSLAHINLMFGIEQAFGVRFKGNELADMKNIGELKQFLIGKGAS